ncbi:helix-turn-helix transcriptional regulator [Streptomyces malaysiensis subsp. malaysiensis]|uniref:helix-turn-helix domain-containing protein n=1 Tax=Streptomyces malaysiensis TaxID=92644 RepID=UPI0024C013DB|nr:helix-turn-helix transcriptional regulator [Streptomyces sp. NA07423]WHX19797.1 helix-turn-helix transcriptional regulator [Streptomyces sp. NA07423]
MTTAAHHPGEPDPPAEEPAASRGEDLATLLTRVLEETGRTQKELAKEAGIAYPTLNAWMNRTRGTSRVSPDKLRDLAAAIKIIGGEITVRDVFEASGRRVPGPTDQEREARLLAIYRALPVESQRAVLQFAEAMNKAARAS